MNVVSKIYENFEYPAFGFGAILGVMQSPVVDVVVTVILAFLTGAAGALGAHLVKALIEYVKRKRNGIQRR
jgi:hypothetical protein